MFVEPPFFVGSTIIGKNFLPWQQIPVLKIRLILKEYREKLEKIDVFSYIFMFHGYHKQVGASAWSL